jgi:hypothetical protein
VEDRSVGVELERDPSMAPPPASCVEAQAKQVSRCSSTSKSG